MAPELFSAASIRLPSRLLRYDILRRVGQGGMGVVYEGRDLELGRAVALKFLSPDILASPERTARFRNEARAISALNHPHIATIFAIEDISGLPFLVLEYLPGGSLRDRLSAIRKSANTLSRGEAIEWGLQVAAGLAHAHRHGIVHRDIKPSNLLFTDEGNIKIVDFGLAKMNSSALPDSLSLTQPGVAVGTPLYMSPEQASGKRVNQRTDVFSLGLVLLELLTGRPPFPGQHAPFPESDLDPRLKAVLARALANRAEDRYSDAGELEAELRRLSRPGLAVSAETATMPVPAPRKVRGRALLAAGAVAAGLAAVAITPAARNHVMPWTRAAQPLPAEKRIAVLLFTNVGGDPANLPIVDGLMEIVSNALSRLEEFHGALNVIPASDVRRENVASARDAGRVLAASMALTGSVQRLGPGEVQVLLNLVDTRTVTQLRTETIRAKLTDLVAFQDGVVQKVARMLEMTLLPQAAQGISAGNTSVPAAYPHYVEGLGYLRRYDRAQNIDSSIAAFERAIALDPKFVLAYAGMAQAWWRKYDLGRTPESIDTALDNASRALALNDTLPAVHITMGMIRAGKGQYGLAEQEMQRALKLDPFNADAYRELAAAYDAMGRTADAERTFRKAVELRRDDWWSVKQLGVFYFNKGRYAEAERCFREVIKLTPDSAKAYSNLGAALLKKGDYDGAAAALERSVSIEPNANGYSNLGSVYYYYGGRYADAAALYEKAVQLTPTDSRFWINLADAYRAAPGLRSKAGPTYRRAIQLIEQEIAVNPRDAQLHSKLATSRSALGEHEQAIAEIVIALGIAPADGAVRFRAAIVYEEARRRDRALRELEAAMRAHYSATEIRQAPPLDGLRRDPRFRRLAARFGLSEPFESKAAK
jgi:tetratricopeptide (TPR) repeat protein